MATARTPLKAGAAGDYNTFTDRGGQKKVCAYVENRDRIISIILNASGKYSIVEQDSSYYKGRRRKSAVICNGKLGALPGTTGVAAAPVPKPDIELTKAFNVLVGKGR